MVTGEVFHPRSKLAGYSTEINQYNFLYSFEIYYFKSLSVFLSNFLHITQLLLKLILDTLIIQ